MVPMPHTYGRRMTSAPNPERTPHDPETDPPRTGFAQPEELVRQRAEFPASGASGIHADQQARWHRAGQANRIGSRSAQLTAAIRAEYR
jgi:hypothetical protein